jgi:hypothetical protein
MPPPHPKAGPPPDAFASTVLSLLQAAPGHRLCVNSLHAQLPRALIPPTKREGGKGNFQGWLAQVPGVVRDGSRCDSNPDFVLASAMEGDGGRPPAGGGGGGGGAGAGAAAGGGGAMRRLEVRAAADGPCTYHYCVQGGVAATHTADKCGHLQRIASKVAVEAAKRGPAAKEAPRAARGGAAAMAAGGGGGGGGGAPPPPARAPAPPRAPEPAPPPPHPLRHLPPAPPGTWTCTGCTLNNRLADLQCVACGADLGPLEGGAGEEYAFAAAPAPPPAPTGGGWPLPPTFALPPLPAGTPPVAGRMLLFCLRILLGAAMMRLGRGQGHAPLPPPLKEELADAAEVFYDLEDLGAEAGDAGLVREGDAGVLEAAGGLRAALARCGAGIVALPNGSPPRAVLGPLGVALLAELAKR